GEARRVGAWPAAEIEQARTGRDARIDFRPEPRAHRAERRVVGVRAVVAGRDSVERPLRIEERVAEHHVHGALLHEVLSEHTQRSHTGLAPTSRRSRNRRKLSDTIRSSGISRMLPTTPWKKHGRTLPLASTTTETHGAEHETAGNGASPRSAA